MARKLIRFLFKVFLFNRINKGVRGKMTDIIIVHSKHGNSKNHWYEWLRHNLTLEGYDVSLFNLEANDHAQIDEWVNEMKQQLHIRKKIHIL